mmetsp:Transcript_24746/g.30442  ORF Transcript_24746/g.30442 Transcript_24746/m.30442 type:complete len:414 (-) Transcript_24746:106-1347(-)
MPPTQQYTEAFLRTRSVTLIQEKAKNVQIIDSEKEKAVPRFHPNEIMKGSFLGKGGYCTVTDLKVVNLKSSDSEEKKSESSNNNVISFDSESRSEGEMINTTDLGGFLQSREFIATQYIRDGKARYAIKKLTPGLYEAGDAHHFVAGVIDLAMEVKFLSVIQHPHIIKLRAIADVGYCDRDFFILMDRLNEILSDRVLKTWKKQMPSGFGPSAKEKKEEFFYNRLQVGSDICDALLYLHNNNIVYRDLKPDNIGFDVRDDVKIFDFGLATETVESKRVQGTDTYKLSGDTGSPRYMAPEVAKSEPYNKKSDVYSFILILWMILELKQPFEKFGAADLKKKVHNGNHTPKVNSKWSDRLKKLMDDCWTRDLKNRKSSEEVKQILKAEMMNFGNDFGDHLNISCKTELSLKNLKL